MRSSSVPRALLVKTGVVVVSILVALVTLEGAYRGYKYLRYGMVEYIDLNTVGYFEPHSVYGHVLAKNFRSDNIPLRIRQSVYGQAYHMDRLFTTNRRGYRGKDFSIRKDRGTFRVVAFGGSTTLSVEVDDFQTWPALLEAGLERDSRFLRKHGARRVEVINAAVGGWRSREAVLRLREEVRRFEPDLLLLAFNWNDFGMAMKGHEPDAVMQPLASPWQPLWGHMKILENLRIRYINYRFNEDKTNIRRLRSALRSDEAWVQSLTRHVLAMQAIASEIKAEIALVNLPGLCRTAAQAREAALVVERTRVTRKNFPLWVEIKDFETEVFRDLGRGHGIRFVDVHRHFEAFSGAERLVLFFDEMHMTGRGTQETAEAIRLALTS